MSIYPIPTGRISDVLVTRRMMNQLQNVQKRLLTVEQQLSTGRRIQLASEDASAANRAVALQRMLETKTQLETNLSTSQAFLDATDGALSSVADLLNNARGLAVRAADSTTSESERNAMALEVQATLNQMLNIGNEQFRGRYLFAGSATATRPFDTYDNYVAYRGNNTALRTYANQELLFDTNVPGQELFGAVSSEVEGGDRNPALTAHTRLADLRGGLGITPGTLVISDGSHTSKVSLVGAETVGDVVRRLESNPPKGREIHVTIGACGLRVEMDATGGGYITIRDEQGGKTAAQLGILRTTGRAVDPIEGSDLDPVLSATTSLDDILGGWDQDSGLRITNGDETHVIDLQAAETIQDLLNILNSSGAMVLAEINAARTGICVRSRLSGGDFSIGENGGTTATDLGLRSLMQETRLTALNHRQGVTTVSGADFTIRRTDGVELAIDVSSAETVGDVIDLINNHPDNLDPATAVTAGLRAVGNGLELIEDHPAGSGQLSVSRANLSLAAWDLGLLPRDADVTTAGGTPVTLSGSDPNPLETQGIFNTLIRLRDAIERFDVTELERITQMLDADSERLTFARAEIGTRGQSLEALTRRNEDEQVELKSALSAEIDMDLAQAASDYATRQAAYEAAIRSIANLHSLSLLDFM